LPGARRTGRASHRLCEKKEGKRRKKRGSAAAVGLFDMELVDQKAFRSFSPHQAVLPRSEKPRSQLSGFRAQATVLHLVPGRRACFVRNRRMHRRRDLARAPAPPGTPDDASIRGTSMACFRFLHRAHTPFACPMPSSSPLCLCASSHSPPLSAPHRGGGATIIPPADILSRRGWGLLLTSFHMLHLPLSLSLSLSLSHTLSLSLAHILSFLFLFLFLFSLSLSLSVCVCVLGDQYNCPFTSGYPRGTKPPSLVHRGAGPA